MISLSAGVAASLLRWEELDLPEKDLLYRAALARRRAVAAYSHYLVGAAILWSDGEISVGWNVENCIYNVLHAEKNAIGQGTDGSNLKRIRSVAVIGDPESKAVIVPPSVSDGDWFSMARKIRFKDCCVSCGQCLQDILEFSFGENVWMYMILSGVVVRTSLIDLLPARFGPHDLGIDYGKRGRS